MSRNDAAGSMLLHIPIDKVLNQGSGVPLFDPKMIKKHFKNRSYGFYDFAKIEHQGNPIKYIKFP